MKPARLTQPDACSHELLPSPLAGRALALGRKPVGGWGQLPVGRGVSSFPIYRSDNSHTVVDMAASFAEFKKSVFFQLSWRLETFTSAIPIPTFVYFIMVTGAFSVDFKSEFGC